MLRIRSLAAAVVLVALAVPCVAEEHPAADPKALIRNLYDQIDKIIKETKGESEMRERIREKMDTFVDFELFGKLALKKHWDELNPDQRKEYLDLFKKLIQRTYLKRFHANKPFSVKLEEPPEFNTKRTKALVKSIITSGKISADVNYKLYVPEGKKAWWAYDVVVDEVSYMRNYRKSFQKTWEKGGYERLVDKMRKKADKPLSDEESDQEDF